LIHHLGKIKSRTCLIIHYGLKLRVRDLTAPALIQQPLDIALLSPHRHSFLNLLSPSIALSFRDAWNSTSLFHDELPGDLSKGMVSVTVAQVQGKEGNVQRLLNECRCGKITNPKFQPVVYDQAGARLDFSQMMNQGESQESSVLREI
jgi:hypothetical protein